MEMKEGTISIPPCLEAGGSDGNSACLVSEDSLFSATVIGTLEWLTEQTDQQGVHVFHVLQANVDFLL